eukprot:CCRYP_018247-RB/>CCRYP_018247-RB protein AED:0.48 eAED:0.48 QI:0/-1/0/1/-1/0/1/0/57
MPNHQHQSRLTTQQLLALSPIPFNPNEPKPWTCDSIGYDVEPTKNSSAHTGGREPQT